MGTIVKRSNKYRVQVFKKGVRLSKTFDTKAAAQRWMYSIESQIDSGEYFQAPDITLAELIEKYLNEKTKLKRGAKNETYRLTAIANAPMGKIKIGNLTKHDLEQWQAERLKTVSTTTVVRERSSLSAVFSQAIRWEYLKSNPFVLVDKPTPTPPRTRRITQNEIDRLVFVSGFSYELPPTTVTSRTGAGLLFAIETAMRASEICGLQWENINLEQATAYIPMSKNGYPRLVPLSATAIRILQQLLLVKDESNDSVFQVKTSSLVTLFGTLKEKAGLKNADLHFHDSRREALSRLANKVDVMTLAKISGHRDLRILLNTYYAPDMSEVAKKLNQ